MITESEVETEDLDSQTDPIISNIDIIGENDEETD